MLVHIVFWLILKKYYNWATICKTVSPAFTGPCFEIWPTKNRKVIFPGLAASSAISLWKMGARLIFSFEISMRKICGKPKIYSPKSDYMKPHKWWIRPPKIWQLRLVYKYLPHKLATNSEAKSAMVSFPKITVFLSLGA